MVQSTHSEVQNSAMQRDSFLKVLAKEARIRHCCCKRSVAFLFMLACSVFCLSSATAEPHPISWEKESLPAGGAKGFVELANGDLLVTRTMREQQATKIICSKSQNGGRTWQAFSTIVRDETPEIDIGDGHLIELRDRTILYSYRRNVYRGSATNQPRYQILVAVSRDGGASWASHSTVKSVHAQKGEVRGLWSSALHQRQDGTLLCFYDDEDEAWRAGFKRHQWLMMKRWDVQASAWTTPVIVSRAFNCKHLSRDGMPSVVELQGNTLLCALESVATEKPHHNVIRIVKSCDGGNTWSWQMFERQILYAPAKRHFSAVSPWLSQMKDGCLLCAFATEEDRDTPATSGAAIKAMNRDIKYVLSIDAGMTWTQRAMPIAAETHTTYMPQMEQLRHPRHTNAFLCLYLDTVLGFRCRRGYASVASHEHAQ